MMLRARIGADAAVGDVKPIGHGGAGEEVGIGEVQVAVGEVVHGEEWAVGSRRWAEWEMRIRW